MGSAAAIPELRIGVEYNYGITLAEIAFFRAYVAHLGPISARRSEVYLVCRTKVPLDAEGDSGTHVAEAVAAVHETMVNVLF